MKEHLKRTNDRRKSSALFQSYKTFHPVTTCTLARWLRTVLEFSGLKIFTAHSLIGASASAAYFSGASMKKLLEKANWTSSKIFFKFYFKLEWNTSKDGHFASAVLNRWFVYVLSKWTVTQLFGQCSFWKSVINLTYSFEYIFCIWKF